MALGLLGGALLTVNPFLRWLSAAAISHLTPAALVGSLGIGVLCMLASLAGGFGLVRRDLAAGSLLTVGALIGWGALWSLPVFLPLATSILYFGPMLVGTALTLAAGVTMATYQVELPRRPDRDAPLQG
jgi:hypothetical protein